jgi:hypothetical protein
MWSEASGAFNVSAVAVKSQVTKLRRPSYIRLCTTPPKLSKSRAKNCATGTTMWVSQAVLKHSLIIGDTFNIARRMEAYLLRNSDDSDGKISHNVTACKLGHGYGNRNLISSIFRRSIHDNSLNFENQKSSRLLNL